MACLTGEQLAALALGLSNGESLPAHVEECAVCRAKLAEMRRVTKQLSAAHADLDRAHVASRSRLLASLSSAETPAQPVEVWSRLTSNFERLTMRQRIAAAGAGLSTALGLLLILLVFGNSAGQLSAMERMAKQLRNVESFSYKLSKTLTSKPEAVHHPLIIQRNDSTAWRAPDPSQAEMLGSLHATTKIVHIKSGATDAANAQMRVHVEENYPVGEPGILIDHMEKTYFRTPPVRADELSGDSDSPIRMLQIVREEGGKLVRELGAKEIGGKQARGYLVAFKAYAPFRRLDSVEVWIDPETDLPLEFGYEAENKWKREVFRVIDCRWNIDLDPKLFDTTPPAGYDDITLPSDEQALADIADALELYADLADGHYPVVKEFHGDAIRDEMLKLAGFTEPPQPEWIRDPKFQQIDETTAGLDWITRIMRNQPWRAGYYGHEVGRNDKDKVLLWWNVVDPTPSYRVFYGDLRTEIVNEARWKELVPTETTQ